PGFSVVDALAQPYPGSPTTSPIDAIADTIFTPANTFGCGPLPVSQFPFLSQTSPALGQTPFVVSAAACALALRPSTIVVSIGNNDALQALTFGVPPTP